MYCSMNKGFVATLLGAATFGANVFGLMYSKGAQTTAAIFGECCKNATIVKNCQDVVCDVITAEMQKNWVVRVVTGVLFPVGAIGFTILVARCTCMGSEDMAEIERRAGILEAGLPGDE